MWRTFAVVLLALLLSPLAYSQTTSVSGTFTDSAGTVWRNGTYSSSPTNPTAQYFQNGVPFNKNTIISGSLDGAGSLTSIGVPDNLGIVPSGSTYNLQICPAATATNGCFIRNLVITGASMNVTSSVIPPPIVVNLSNPLPGAAAYNDAEIVGARQGSVYFNLTDNSLHTCGGFPVCIWIVSATTGATGTVTSVSDGGFAPLFTTNVATPTTTPAITNTAISQNANTFYAGPSGTAIDLVDFAIVPATGNTNSISISATPKQSGDLALLLTSMDVTTSVTYTPDVSWTRSFLGDTHQSYFYKNVSGLTPASASGTFTATNPDWSAALALFTANPGFTPTVTHQSNVVSGSCNFTGATINFTPTAGRTFIVVFMSGNTNFFGLPTNILSFTDSVGDVFAPLAQVTNPAGSGTELTLLAASNIAGGATTFSCIQSPGVADGIVDLFEVTNLAPITPSFGPMTVRRTVGADLPRPTPVGVGGGFSKPAVTNQFLTAVNLDGTIGQAQPSFANLSGTIAAGQVPATTSNCTGNNFAQGLNAGFTPICAAAATATVQVFTNQNLAGDVAVSANTLTTIDSVAVTMPASGGPWRAQVTYNYFFSGGVNGECTLSDGTTSWAQMEMQPLNNIGSCQDTAWSKTTYANGAVVTFTVNVWDTGATTAKATSNFHTAVASYLQVAIVK